MNKIIRLTESDLHRLVKESVQRVLKEGIGQEVDSRKFSLAMHKLYSIAKEEIGGEGIRETIASWFWLDWNGETKVVPCKFDEKGMYYLAYSMCNYDIICLKDNGRVDIVNSNNPQAAKLIAPYLSIENGMRIVENLYGR